MDNSNTPESVTETKQPGKGKNLIIGLLAAGILVLGGFLIFDHNKNSETIKAQQTEVARVTSEKSEIQGNFDASLARLDSMTSLNADMQNQLAEKDAEIEKIKKEIRSILNKKNASASELSRARKLIAKLNTQISDMEQQIAMLTQQNDTLKAQNTVLITNNQSLTHNLDSTLVVNTSLVEKVEVASTLNASNITITPIKVKNNGKEKVKTSARQVDKLEVSFDVRNRIIQPGTFDIYVVVIGPDGKPVTSTPGSGTFTSRDGGEIYFTAKLPVTLETSKNKKVEFAFDPADEFQEGDYIVKIYQNGFLIGEGTRKLTKGGLFG